MKIKGFALRESEIKSKRRARVTENRVQERGGGRLFCPPGPISINSITRLQTERLRRRRRPKPKDNHPVAGSKAILHVAPAAVGSTREEIAEISYAGASLLLGEVILCKYLRARDASWRQAVWTPPPSRICEMNSLVRGLKKYPHETRWHAFGFLCMHGLSQTTLASGCVQEK
jgi:hypothetical protein